MAYTEDIGRHIVAERSSGRCEIAIDDVCTGIQRSVHHRVKRSQGGTWAPSNLLASCGDGTRDCHGFVEAHPNWAKTRGLWLLPSMDSLVEPALMRWADSRSWWRLDDEGMLHGMPGAPIEEIRYRRVR